VNNIQVSIYLITGNGSFTVIDKFKLQDKPFNFSDENTLYWSFNESGMYIILVRADLINGTRFDEFNISNNRNYITINVRDDIKDKTSNVLISFTAFLVIGVIIFVIMLLSILLFIERTRYAILKTMLGQRKNKLASKSDAINMNSKAHKDIRNSILTYIRLNPGATYTELKIQQDLSNTKLIRYLEIFKKEKFIIIKYKGPNITFHPTFSETKK
jgi:hypothetical protein